MNCRPYLNQLINTGIYINHSGFFFDFLFKEIPKEFFIQIKDININSEEIQILKYPNFEDLFNNIEKIKSTKNICFILYTTQIKEIEFLSIYFKLIDYLDIKIQPHLMIEFSEIGNYNFNNLKEKYEDSIVFKYIYMFILLKENFNLNPSKLYKLNKNNIEHIFSMKDFKENLNKKGFPKAFKYFKKANGYLNINILLDLINFDLTKYSNERIEYIFKLIEFEDYGNIDKKELNVSDDLIKKYTRGENTIAWEKANGKIFFMGGYSNI